MGTCSKSCRSLNDRQKRKKELLERIEYLSCQIIEKIENAMDVVNNVSARELAIIMEDLRATEIQKKHLESELAKYKTYTYM